MNTVCSRKKEVGKIHFPEVSAIIPTYNRAHILPRAISSVLNQSFQDFELIVVDDGSVDATREVVADSQAKDARITYIYQENSGGPASPKNTGVKHATGEYIAFLDDDDEWLPQKIEKQVKLLKSASQKNVGFVGCSFTDINIQKSRMQLRKIPRFKNALKAFIEHNFLIPSSAVVRRDVFREVGLFDPAFVGVADDDDMWIRIAQKYDFDFVSEPLVKRYIHGGNITETSNYLAVVKSIDYLLAKHKSCYEKYPIVHSKWLAHVGTICALGGNMKSARQYFMQSIQTAFYYPRNYVNLFLSLFGEHLYRKVVLLKRKMNGNVGV